MIKTFRAKSIQQALELVRQELGPDASVLHTRRLNAGLVGRLLRGSEVEVAAAAPEPSFSIEAAGDVGVALADEPVTAPEPPITLPPTTEAEPDLSADFLSADFDHRARYREQLAAQSPEIPSLFDSSAASAPEVSPSEPATHDGPTAQFDVFTRMIDAEIDETVCRDLLDRVRPLCDEHELRDPEALLWRVRQLIASQLKTSGPIVAGRGDRRLVALVGPTGVGKTTTIAKLAADFRLRKRLNVGLITVDTYRVSAVEQLQTYAEIIDLPMEIVATPREMRRAVERFADMDLVLLDTAGRSPRDEVRVQELKSILAEAQPDETHLVLSVTSSVRSLVSTAEKFKEVGVSSILLTKLDEALGLGQALSLARESRLPISYLTNGQNVPDDIEVAEASELAEAMLATATTGAGR